MGPDGALFPSLSSEPGTVLGEGTGVLPSRNTALGGQYILTDAPLLMYLIANSMGGLEA